MSSNIAHPLLVARDGLLRRAEALGISDELAFRLFRGEEEILRQIEEEKSLRAPGCDDGWTPVSKGLPEPGTLVANYYQHNGTVWAGQFNDKQRPTHYFVLPPLPVKEQS